MGTKTNIADRVVSHGFIEAIECLCQYFGCFALGRIIGIDFSSALHPTLVQIHHLALVALDISLLGNENIRNNVRSRTGTFQNARTGN